MINLEINLYHSTLLTFYLTVIIDWTSLKHFTKLKVYGPVAGIFLCLMRSEMKFLSWTLNLNWRENWAKIHNRNSTYQRLMIGGLLTLRSITLIWKSILQIHSMFLNWLLKTQLQQKFLILGHSHPLKVDIVCFKTTQLNHLNSKAKQGQKKSLKVYRLRAVT